MKKAALTVMILTILSKVLGFGREMVMSYVYGASALTDAYLISQTIPNFIFSFLSAGLATAFIPMYSRALKEEGRLRADSYTSTLNNILLIIATISVTLIMSFPEALVKVFASGFKPETVNLAVKLTRISAFGVYFTALLGILQNYLRLYDKFAIPTLVGFSFNIVIIGFLILSFYTNIYVLARAVS